VRPAACRIRGRALAAALAAAALLAGCGLGTDSAPSSGSTSAATADAAVLLEAAEQAWTGSDRAALAPALRQAAASCPDPATAKRLGEVAAVAARWAQAVEDNRPKVQARTEAQLGEVDWQALAAACAPS
jgi:hypothetical protein